MNNTEHAYHEAGYKAGRAMRQGDAALYRFQKDWFTRALSLETDHDKAEARRLWAAGYAEAQPAHTKG